MSVLGDASGHCGRTGTGFGIRCKIQSITKSWPDVRRDFVWVTGKVRDFAESSVALGT